MALNWKNLTKQERQRYMQFQMSSRYGGRDGHLPDDCSDCNVCGNPVWGYGFCKDCSNEFESLIMKLGLEI